MAKVSAAANASSLPQKDKSKKKHAFGKKKSKKNGNILVPVYLSKGTYN